MGRILVAADPGQSGAFVWSKDGDPEITCDKMPTTDVEVAQYIADLSIRAKDVELYLEEPSLTGYGPGIPGYSIARLAQNFGMIYGAAVAQGFIIHRVKPQAWQAAHSLGQKKDHGKKWKHHLKARALELYGSRIDVALWNADALLLYHAAARGAIN